MKRENSLPTMKDVAREAGVSLGTVSKVVNGLPVGEPYRTKVEKAVRKLNYQINSYAQGLKTDRTNTIALLVPDLRDPFFAILTHYISRALQSRHYKMLLCTTDSDAAQEQEHLSMLRNSKVDGIIGLSCNPASTLPEGIPFVSVGCSMGPHVPCVTCDNFAGGLLAAETLANSGCRNVVFLCTDSFPNSELSKRRAGFENGCLAGKMNFETLIWEDDNPRETIDAFLTRCIRHGKTSADGIFCMTDRMACRVIQALKRINLKVPEDVQVIGFDGIRQFGDSGYLCSTIVQPVREMAATCVDLLLRESDYTVPQHICLPVSYACGGTARITPP